MTTEDTTTPVEHPETKLDAAVVEATKDHTVTVLGKEFKLVKDLSLIVTYSLDKAQREESVSGLVDALSKVVHKDDRKAFRDLILSDDDEGDEDPLSLEDFFDVFADALQKVAGRPLGT